MPKVQAPAITSTLVVLDPSQMFGAGRAIGSSREVAPVPVLTGCGLEPNGLTTITWTVMGPALR